MAGDGFMLGAICWRPEFRAAGQAAVSFVTPNYNSVAMRRVIPQPNPALRTWRRDNFLHGSWLSIAHAFQSCSLIPPYFPEGECCSMRSSHSDAEPATRVAISLPLSTRLCERVLGKASSAAPIVRWTHREMRTAAAVVLIGRALRRYRVASAVAADCASACRMSATSRASPAISPVAQAAMTPISACASASDASLSLSLAARRSIDGVRNASRCPIMAERTRVNARRDASRPIVARALSPWRERVREPAAMRHSARRDRRRRRAAQTGAALSRRAVRSCRGNAREGGTADIGTLDDVGDRETVVAAFEEELRKRIHQRGARALDAPVDAARRQAKHCKTRGPRNGRIRSRTPTRGKPPCRI